MTLKELKQKHPELITELENETLQKLGVSFSGKERKERHLTEDKAVKLTNEEKSQIRTSAKMAAGIVQ